MDNRFHKHIFHQVSTLNVNNVRMVEEQLMILVPWCPFSRPGAVDKTTKTNIIGRLSFGIELVFGLTRGTDVVVTPGFTKIVISTNSTSATPQNTTAGTKTHESGSLSAPKATSPIPGVIL
ncbi:CRE_collapsed_G0017050.mRNA.1.CDS.1 [Saccharomyces cerevisiae]|nr:CEQ_1a_G0016480.mRNA.1.CDS.1 [Saccharomyces cerevisiae]CAI4456044.1 AEG_G0017970.mRNA.1.CDS.1 [Saccharomyces cerevisiae]CAI4924827.1 CRE_HP_G0019230.mRNA.1.CDS.1 [Saccharomyces cerevisiae]CAI4995851.1 CRE_HP_G0069910.mRNA.1.CDS.1 [Saccharomyces cerevisiae]CAI5131974.1 CRE_HP_G0136430.mRNA.1.CDS.1 [Saccharomyces cerevisiae]